MGNVVVFDQVGRCYSNADGLVLQKSLLHHLSQNDTVTVDFRGIDGVTSSFINTALIELLDHFDFDFIKAHIKFVNTNTQINKMIRDRFSSETKRRANLLHMV